MKEFKGCLLFFCYTLLFALAVIYLFEFLGKIHAD